MSEVPDIVAKDEDYEFGFHDDVKPAYSTGRGLTEATVREISAAKNEPEWMLAYRLKAYEAIKKCLSRIMDQTSVNWILKICCTTRK